VTRRYRPTASRYASPRFLTTYHGPYTDARTMELARFVAAKSDRLLVVRNGARLQRVLGVLPWLRPRVLVHAELTEGKHLDPRFGEMVVDEAAYLSPLVLERLQTLTRPRLVMYANGHPTQEGVE
jgi:hypothetical protein